MSSLTRVAAILSGNNNNNNNINNSGADRETRFATIISFFFVVKHGRVYRQGPQRILVRVVSFWLFFFVGGVFCFDRTNHRRLYPETGPMNGTGLCRFPDLSPNRSQPVEDPAPSWNPLRTVMADSFVFHYVHIFCPNAATLHGDPVANAQQTPPASDAKFSLFLSLSRSPLVDVSKTFSDAT